MLMRNGNSMAVYLFNLSISDLLYTISLPVWIELALQRPLGGLCSLVAVIMYNSFYVGSGLLCCISVDRYLAVVYPLHFHWVREVRTAAIVSIALWTLEITIHIILLDHTGALQAFSSRKVCEERIPMTQEDGNLALTRVTLGFLVPIFIMAFCFQQIMQSLKKNTSILTVERRKVGLLLFYLLLTYIVAFMPYQIVMLLRAILEPGTCSWATRLRDPYLVTVATTTINSSMDRMYEHINSTSAMENLTLSSNHSECYPVDSASRRRSFMFFYLAIIVTAIPSNAFSLYVSWQHIRQKNGLGVYLFNLALSDLTFTIGLSLWLDFLWKGLWVHGGYVCMLSVYFLYTNFYTSEALLCCIAVDRYLAVVHPFKYTFLRKVNTAAAVGVTIWVLVFCFNATTISWEDSYHEYNKFAVCFDISLPLSGNLAWASVARFILGFIIPFLLVVFSTWGIWEAVKSNQATKERERKRILKLLTVVLLCVLFCFGPIHVMMLLRTQMDDCREVAWLLYPYKISIALSSLNCLADPLLYCFITRTGKANVNQVVLFFQVKKRSNDEDVV
ncbi:psychosine receptor-like [Trematomus bernacchii]|uniref:psychosine receptor-like n=1 Tax=Trematomus bernacchii TaxID=40690 RepID=UPI00146BE128|nr:psychosine receptor-like [Trematomus bernacchii]